MTSNEKSDSQVPQVVGARVGELAPLVGKWIKQNPNAKVSCLVKRGLKLALKPLAGKRQLHLVED